MKQYMGIGIVTVIVIVIIGLALFAQHATGGKNSQSSIKPTDDPLPPGAMARDTTVAPTPPK